MKWRLLRLTLFCPVLYEVGLQIVLCGDGLASAVGSTRDLQKHVDLISNQLVTLQSIFVVDLADRWYAPARTWGQLISGPFQNSIAEGIRQAGYVYFESK